MISPPSASYSGGPRRTRYSRSPSDGDVLPSKRSKPSNSSDPYDRDHGSKSDQHRLYTSICVKNINPKITDLGKKKKRRLKLDFLIFLFLFFL